MIQIFRVVSLSHLGKQKRRPTEKTEAGQTLWPGVCIHESFLIYNPHYHTPYFSFRELCFEGCANGRRIKKKKVISNIKDHFYVKFCST